MPAFMWTLTFDGRIRCSIQDVDCCHHQLCPNCFRMLARLLFLTVLVVAVHGHSFHFGKCPSVEPFPDFDMSKFLGKWYVIQKTKKSTRCLTYNYTSSSEPHKYFVQQSSEHSTLKLLGFGNKYRFSGDLTVPSLDSPANMLAKLPLGIGSASYTVFDTDYDTYGAVFACQNILVGNRQAATILSRHRTLDNIHLRKIRSKLEAFGIDTSELSVINQDTCHEDENTKLEVKVEDEGVVGIVHKGGTKTSATDEVVTEADDIDIRKAPREEIDEHQDSNEVEWLP